MTEKTDFPTETKPHHWYDDYQDIGSGYRVAPEHKIVTCCGCGFPVDQNNERSFIMTPDGYMGTYGPCCAPTGRKLTAMRKRWARYRADDESV